MALLKDSDFEQPNPLSLELDLLGLEIYEDRLTEGWFKYSLTLRHEEIVAQIYGTLHDSDLRVIENRFNELKAGEFEPMEPDFHLNIKSLVDDEYSLTCMVNHSASINGIYRYSAVGIRIAMTEETAREFANDLKIQRLALTDDMEFGDFTARPLPKNRNSGA